MGDSRRSVATLLLIACHRLKLGGRLVFWLPTSAETSFDALIDILHDIEKLTYSDIEKDLKFLSATPQHLHSKLSRWLCVYEKY